MECEIPTLKNHQLKVSSWLPFVEESEILEGFKPGINKFRLTNHS